MVVDDFFFGGKRGKRRERERERPMDEETEEDETLDELYRREFKYHFCGWLQSAICVSFAKKHGASVDDMKCLWPEEEPFLERCWSRFSSAFKQSMLKTDFGVCRDIQERADWLNTIDRTMDQLAKYSSLTPEQQSEHLDGVFKDPLVRSKPPQFPLNLHVHRNQGRSATGVILSMSPNHWTNWARFMDGLDLE